MNVNRAIRFGKDAEAANSAWVSVIEQLYSTGCQLEKWKGYDGIPSSKAKNFKDWMKRLCKASKDTSIWLTVLEPEVAAFDNEQAKQASKSAAVAERKRTREASAANWNEINTRQGLNPAPVAFVASPVPQAAASNHALGTIGQPLVIENDVDLANAVKQRVETNRTPNHLGSGRRATDNRNAQNDTFAAVNNMALETAGIIKTLIAERGTVQNLQATGVESPTKKLSRLSTIMNLPATTPNTKARLKKKYQDELELLLGVEN